MFVQRRNYFLKSLLGLFAVSVASLFSQSAFAQGLVYVDASHINPINLTPFTAIDDAMIPAAERWSSRQDFASGSQDISPLDGIGVYEAPNGDSTVTGAPELMFTFTGAQALPAGNWDLYAVYWTDNDENWTISTGLTSGNLSSYSYTGSSGRFPDTIINTTKGLYAGLAQWDTLPPVTRQGTTLYDRPGGDPLVMLLGHAGTVNADGVSDVTVFIDDLPGQGGGRRSWFDGVAYIPAGTTINTLNATIDRGTGELVLSNPSNVDYQIKSVSIESVSGALNATQWNPITGSLDDGTFDSDAWVISSPVDPPDTIQYATVLAESENVLGDGVGGVLTAMGGSLSSINFGNVWRPVPFDEVTRLGEDVVLSITLGDGTQVTIAPDFTGTPIPFGSFNEDTDVDESDYQILLDNLNSNVWDSETIAERYQKGDLNNDRMVNYYDLLAFRTLYDDLNGNGAFSSMLAAQVPEPGSLGLVLSAAVLAFFYRRRGRLTSASVALFISLLSVTSPCSAIDIKVDIDSMRTNATTAATPFVTQPGFTSWDLTNVGNTVGSNVMTIDGITFEIFGFPTSATDPAVGINQSRIRTTGGGGPYNDLLADFVYNEGAGNRAVGLRMTDLPVGLYHMYSWHYDGINATDATRVEVRDQGVGGSAINLTSSLWSQHPIPVVIEVVNTMPPKEMIYREFSTANRARLNGFTIEDFNGVTLEVTTNTGAMRLLNEQGSSIDLTYYEIHSVSGQLTGSWDSIDSTESGDPVGTGWDEVTNTNEFFLGEARLEGATTLAQTGMQGDSIALGNAFALNGTEDLYFVYGTPGQEFLRAGYVKYVTSDISLDGDYNNDGMVDARDFVVWRDNLGNNSLVLPGDTTPGTVTDADYDVWVQNFGATPGSGSGSVAAAVPEPASVVLLGVALLGFGLVRKRR